jgi:hypothetical protein
MRETYSLTQINNATSEPSARSFDAVRRFVFENSSTGHDLTKIFKNARDELRKFNDGFLGVNPTKSNKE